MKVTKGNTGFQPITIVLETEEEAIAMWLRLNMASHTVASSFDKDGDKGYKGLLSRIDTEMFAIINRSYRPTQEV